MTSTHIAIQELRYLDLLQHPGLLVLEFGANWCGYCRAAQPIIQAALINFPQVKHIKIEDGKGKRLGRQFAIKLWPTLILLIDGVEIKRVVRPDNIESIHSELLLLIKQE